MRIRDWDFNLKMRLFAESVHGLLFWMFLPFMAIYFSDAFGKETAGLLLILSQLFSVFVSLFGGYCADHFGRKRMMFLATAGTAVAFILFAWANSPWLSSPLLTFISFAIMGVLDALYFPASHAMVADVVPEKHRSSVFAVFYTAMNISVVFGPVLGGIFFFDYRFPFLLVCLAASVGIAIVIKRFIRETMPPGVRKEKQKEDDPWYKMISQQLSDYKVITKDGTFLLFIIAGVLIAQTFMQLDLLMAVYTTEHVPDQPLISLGTWSFNLDNENIFSFLISENGFLVALFTVAMTKWMTKYKEQNVFIASACLYGVAIIIYGHTQNIWVLILSMVVFTSAELMTVGLQESFVSRLAPEHMRGQYFAASSLRFSLGRTVAPIAIPMTVWIGFSWTFNILGVLAFSSAVLYYMMFKRMEKERLLKRRSAENVLS